MGGLVYDTPHFGGVWVLGRQATVWQIERFAE
jgi:hypothetical protein